MAIDAIVSLESPVRRESISFTSGVLLLDNILTAAILMLSSLRLIAFSRRIIWSCPITNAISFIPLRCSSTEGEHNLAYIAADLVFEKFGEPAGKEGAAGALEVCGLGMLGAATGLDGPAIGFATGLTGGFWTLGIWGNGEADGAGLGALPNDGLDGSGEADGVGLGAPPNDGIEGSGEADGVGLGAPPNDDIDGSGEADGVGLGAPPNDGIDGSGEADGVGLGALPNEGIDGRGEADGVGLGALPNEGIDGSGEADGAGLGALPNEGIDGSGEADGIGLGALPIEGIAGAAR